MKKIFTLVLLAFLGTGWGFSQSIQLIMSPRPSPYFSDWQNKTETIRMIVNNTSKASIDCKIKTQLFNGKGEMVGETDFNKMPVLTLQPGISQFYAEDIYPLDAVTLFGNSLSSMLKTGRIPEDNYRLCTDLLDPVRGTPLTQSPQCKMFSIIAFQAPVLLTPREDEIIPETGIRAVMFRWTPVTPSSNVLVTYRFQVWEVLDGQTMADACRNNQPIVEKDFRGILQTQWPVDFALPGLAGAGAAAAAGAGGFSIQKYVWSITPYDDQDRKLVIEGYGMAEPFGFSVVASGNTANTPFDLIQVKLSQPPPNQLRLEDLNIQLNNNAKEPTDISHRGTNRAVIIANSPVTEAVFTLTCTLTSAKPKPLLIIIIIFRKFTLPPGTTTFTYDDIKKGDLKFSSDEWAKAFAPGGILTPGDYEICVSVLDKSGKEIGKGCIDQKITGGDACKDFGIVLMDYRKIWKGDSAFVEASITNKYRGDDPKNKPKSFGIKIQNGLVVEFADNVLKGWTRTPSKFPPGSSQIKWTNNSGDIPNGETKFGNIRFANAYTGPISVQYEWLNKDDKVLCSGTIDLPGNSGSGSTGGGSGAIKLISPEGHGGTGDEGSGEEGDLITFKWFAPDNKGPFSIGIVELKESQSPDEAMLKNKAFFEQKNIEGTSFKYPGSAPKFVAGQKYAWWIWAKESRSSISIFDRWGRKVAYSWGTDYHLDNADILEYLQADGITIKKGEYLFDYSTNSNGDVTLPLATPIRDNRLNKAEVMFEGIPADHNCGTDGRECVGGPPSVANGKPSYYTVKPGIANGMIFQIILSYRGGNSGRNDNGGNPAVTVKLNTPAPNQLKLTDLTNFTLTNGILKPLEVVLSCTLTSAKTQPLLIIIIIVLKKFTLPPGPTTFTPDDFKSGDVKFESDEWAKAFGPNGKVPAGDYTLCVSVLDKSGKEIGKGCIEQKIVGGDAPQLISPKDDLTPTTSRPTFEWKMEPALENVTYSITVKELEEGKDIENGVMVLERSNIRENTLPFPKNTPSLDAAKSYAWQVSWFKNGRLMGRTSFTRFSFTKVPDTEAKITLVSPIGYWGVDNGKEGGISFKWTGPNSEGPYFLRIVEIRGDESPDAAMQKNTALFEQKNIDGTTFRYPASAPKFEAGKKYAWAIEDNSKKKGQGVGENGGKALSISNPGSFTLSTCPTLILTPVLECAGVGTNIYNFTLTCQNPANPGTDPNCIWVVTSITAAASYVPVNVTTGLPLSIQPGQTVIITGQIGPILPSGILLFLVNVTDPDGPGTYAPGFTLPLPPSTPGAISGSTGVCQGQTAVVYSISTVSGAASYAWTVPSGATITAGQGTTSITVTFGSSAGDVCVSAVNTCGPSIANCKSITINPLPGQPGTIAGSATPCQGSSQSYSVTNVSGVTYTWTFPAGWTPAGGTTNSVTKTVGAGSGTITVTPSNACGSGPVRTFAVTPKHIPATPGVLTGQTNVCQGQPGTVYSIPPVSGATSYNWSVPSGATIASGQGATSITVTFGILSASGDLCVKAINNCGESTPSCKAITVRSIPKIKGEITGPASVCPGQTGVVYSISAPGGASYSWSSLGAGTITAGQGTTSITINIGSSPGPASICFSASNICGTSVQSCKSITILTVPPAPVATAATDNFIQPNQFTANWNAVAGASGYIIEISTNPGFNISSDTRIVGAVTSFIVTGLTSNATCPKYYYRVTALNNCGGGTISNVITVPTIQTVPHGSWTQGPGTYSFTVGAFGTTANINGCPGQSIPITMELWGAGGAGGDGEEGGSPLDFGGNGGGGGGGGGYAKTTITATVPSTGTRLYYVGVGPGGVAGASLHDGINHRDGVTSQVMLGNTSTMVLEARGGLEGKAGAHSGIPSIAWSGGGAGGSGTINNWSGQPGYNGAIVTGCNGGAGGLGGAGGGPGRTGPGYFNDGGNGGHGGYFHSLTFPTCTAHGQNYLLSPGTAGGNGKVVFTW